jgi:hypothetical protein
MVSTGAIEGKAMTTKPQWFDITWCNKSHIMIRDEMFSLYYGRETYGSLCNQVIYSHEYLARADGKKDRCKNCLKVWEKQKGKQ